MISLLNPVDDSFTDRDIQDVEIELHLYRALRDIARCQIIAINRLAETAAPANDKAAMHSAYQTARNCMVVIDHLVIAIGHLHVTPEARMASATRYMYAHDPLASQS